jgi:hypothetical protein
VCHDGSMSRNTVKTNTTQLYTIKCEIFGEFVVFDGKNEIHI